jgi:2-amino-4-hydroxy-6-hydroxymethyldihydropteridine diphosphokinase
MHQVYLCLGSNLGNRKANLDKAIRLLDVVPDRIGRVSSLYETEPWGTSHHISFYNLAAELITRADPEDLLARLQNIEHICGRIPALERYAPRFMDIDIIFYENLVISAGNLKIPHPLLHMRRFVLTPLAEIAPDHLHPVLCKTVIQLQEACEDEKQVLKIR